MALKKWIIKQQLQDDIKKTAASFNISTLAARVLINRTGTDEKAIKSFLYKDTSSLHSPFIFKDMEKAVTRINKALKNNEKITVYGDYDVDGITSVALICQYLNEKGAETDYYIPDRIEEGYGINLSALDKIKQNNTTLLITVDTGITAYEEIEYAKSIGLDVIITDHHECADQLPVCEAVINPKRPDSEYPDKNLAGVGVAFKLVCALEGENSGKTILKRFSELVAIGTVADVVPVFGENRIIVNAGLKKLLKREVCPGLNELMNLSGIEKGKAITTTMIGYMIAPRINAAGRVGCAEEAVRLLLEKDKLNSKIIADSLCEENRLRQSTEGDLMNEALSMINESFDKTNDKVIVLAKENWHHGIIGIISSRITDIYNLPSILISTGDGIGKGSGRSIKGFSLYNALESCKPFLEKYGGHDLAAGLCLKTKNINAFRKAVNEYAAEKFSSMDLTRTIEADCEISPEEISLKTVKQLEIMEPFGVGNPVPVFLLKNTKVLSVIPLSGGKHIKLNLECYKNNVSAVYFGMAFDSFDIEEGDIVDIMCVVDENNFRDKSTVQLLIKDIRLSEYIRVQKELEDYLNPNLNIFKKSDIPSRENLKNVYLYLKAKKSEGLDFFCIRTLHNKISSHFGLAVSYNKTRLSLVILNELGAIDATVSGMYLETGIIDSTKKVNITESRTFCLIKNIEK